MRFFIALEIPDESRRQLLSLQEKLQQIIPSLKLTDIHKLHLTIAFIGEQNDDLKEPLIDVLNKAVDGISSFSVSPGYIDGFPNLHNLKTLWIGVKGDIDKLHLIRERIKDGLSSLRLPVDERRYTPHIALGKTPPFKLSRTDEEKLQKLMLQDFGVIKVESIKLFESIPTHGFHDHNTLAEIKLT